jgi:hypothetical protein
VPSKLFYTRAPIKTTPVGVSYNFIITNCLDLCKQLNLQEKKGAGGESPSGHFPKIKTAFSGFYFEK